LGPSKGSRKAKKKSWGKRGLTSPLFHSPSHHFPSSPPLSFFSHFFTFAQSQEKAALDTKKGLNATGRGGAVKITVARGPLLRGDARSAPGRPTAARRGGQGLAGLRDACCTACSKNTGKAPGRKGPGPMGLGGKRRGAHIEETKKKKGKGKKKTGGGGVKKKNGACSPC